MAMLKIGLAQTRQTSDFDINAETIFRFLDLAAQSGVQIVCFPETQTVGVKADLDTGTEKVSATTSEKTAIELTIELEQLRMELNKNG